MDQVRNVIVLNDHACINGGQAKVAIESAKGLAARGLKVAYFAACGPIDETLTGAGVRVHCLDQQDILSEPRRLVAATRGLWNIPAARALRTLLAEYSPEDSIVHGHGFAKALSPAIGPVITRGPLKHVYTMHEYFLACPNGGFYDYRANAICRRRALGIDCIRTNCDVRKFSHKLWRVARQGVLWTAGCMPRGLRDVIYISETERHAMAPYFGPQTQLHYVPNPVARPDKPRVQAERNHIFLFIGRLSPEKGGLFFAQAAKQAGVQAVFVGDGSERAAIEAVNPQALITGWVTPPEVETWLEQATCIVFPSAWTETFGLVAYEALVRGVPVITGDWCAAAEVVKDGVTGLIVKNRDTDSWVQAINRIQPVIGEYSVAAYNQLRHTRLELNDHIDRLIEIYNRILVEHPE